MLNPPTRKCTESPMAQIVVSGVSIVTPTLPTLIVMVLTIGGQPEPGSVAVMV